LLNQHTPNIRSGACHAGIYSLFLLELSDLLLEVSDLPGLAGVSDDPAEPDDPEELSDEVELELEPPPSDVLEAEASLPSLLGGRFNPDDDL
jgi:hypothetical protein